MQNKIQNQVKKYEETKQKVAQILESENFGADIYKHIYEAGKDEYKSFLDSEMVKIEEDKEIFFEIIKEQNHQADFALNAIKNLRIQKLREVKGFVASILNPKPLKDENNDLPIKLNKFNDLVKNDYAEFVNKVALANEAELLIKLHSIQEELSRLVSLKDIASKATIAVGGGFSAGKSQFITSFFKDQTIELPIGVQPVTAIASYIVSGNKHIIRGYTTNGAVIEIDTNLYANLSHDFMKELGFNLKTIMPRMAMETKFTDYEHICFIDTPGYNPSGGESTAEDFNTAKEYLDNSDALLWLAPVTNGVLYQSDLDFLRDLNLGDKKLYIVANKADLRSEDDIQSVLDAFEDALYSNNIEYEGISAYSSQDKEELTFRKKSLGDFLNSIKPDHSAKEHIATALNNILKAYANELEQQMQHNKKIKKAISKLELDMIEDGAEFSDKLADSFQNLRELTSSKVIKTEIKDLENLHEKLFDVLDSIFVDVFGSVLESRPKLSESNAVDSKKRKKKRKENQEEAQSVENNPKDIELARFGNALMSYKNNRELELIEKVKADELYNEVFDSVNGFKIIKETFSEILSVCQSGEFDTDKISSKLAKLEFDKEIMAELLKEDETLERWRSECENILKEPEKVIEVNQALSSLIEIQGILDDLDDGENISSIVSRLAKLTGGSEDEVRGELKNFLKPEARSQLEFDIVKAKMMAEIMHSLLDSTKDMLAIFDKLEALLKTKCIDEQRFFHSIAEHLEEQ